MKFDPELWLRIKDKKVTAHQVRILSELSLTHSQTSAASNLGISVPVLHRHLKSLVRKLGVELVTTTPNGTWLTNEGQVLLRIYNRYQEMLSAEQEVSIYCTPITYELVKESMVSFEILGKNYRISINDDKQNLKALYLGRADLVLFDDPVFAMEFEGFKEDKILTTDICNDTLVHLDSGLDYIRLRYGAQRLGFRYLEANQRKYNILYEVSDFKHIINSKKSYFINNSLLERHGIKVKSSSDLDIFNHPIIAVSINPTAGVRELTDSLREYANENMIR
jgi:molybdenum-dependent DNA-binding transcriptional regulator ModE